MKVLALSFGRKMKNCDILAKEALMGAEAAGAEVSFLNMMDKKITHCTGCGACDKRRENGGPSRCVLNDDFPLVEELILAADCLIVVAPVYVLAPTGQYKNLCDRLGPSHDRAVMVDVNNQRIAEGKTGDQLLDPRLFKDRYVGFISVGGATTEHWTSLGLPSMHLLTFSMQMTVVDQYNAYHMGERVHPCFDPELIKRANQMGKNVVSAYGKKREDIAWMGDDDGVCPLCHNKLLTINGTTTVECPICGMSGKLSIVDGNKIKVDFPPEQIELSRLRFGGVQDHHEELSTIMKGVYAKLATDGHRIGELAAKYKDYAAIDEKGVKARIRG